MNSYIEPKSLGLIPRTLVEKINEISYAIVMNRKSRIIMADGKKILANAEKIKKAIPGIQVMLKTTAPVCSKTLHFLAEHDIRVIRE